VFVTNADAHAGILGILYYYNNLDFAQFQARVKAEKEAKAKAAAEAAAKAK
jgi:hypothetical protein